MNELLEKILSKDATISVIGLGYIGLPTSLIFADVGFTVYGYDANEKIVNALKSGKTHIKEGGLQELLAKILKRRSFVPDSKLHISDIYIIAVPTPAVPKGDIKGADLSYVKSATENVAKIIQKSSLVVLESTVPPSTTVDLVGKLIEEKTGLKMSKDFYIAHCPERVLPGKILYELKNNDRIIGAPDKDSLYLAKKLYESILENGKVYTTTTETAELCKLVENAYRDVNIAFANELSMIADKLGIDVFELIKLANKHPRVNILRPGAGVGGHCIPVDPWSIVEKFPEEAKLIKTAREINDYKPQWVVKKIEKEIEYDKSKVIGILGLSYKANVDDLRESPSIKIAKILQSKGYNVLGCEPYVGNKLIDGIENLSLDETVEKADLLVLTTAHNQFIENMDILKNKKVLDIIGALESKGAD